MSANKKCNAVASYSFFGYFCNRFFRLRTALVESQRPLGAKSRKIQVHRGSGKQNKTIL